MFFLEEADGLLWVCVYGISGMPLCKQLPLWRAIAGRLNVLGKPYVMCGDWQVEPEDMRRSGLLALINGVIIAPSSATNVLTGRVIDYFVVSPSLVSSSLTAEALTSCRFIPHLPVCMRISLKVSRAAVRGFALPRPLPAEVPVGPQRPGISVSWEGWAARSGCDSASTPTATSIAHATKVWFAGYEAE